MAAPKASDPDVRVVGAAPPTFRDAYHAFLRMPWSLALALIAAAYLALNAAFAAAYLLAGGIAGARPGSFFDAFAFSVQTMGTIGYGAMYPSSTVANTIVIVESVSGLVVTALATGLVFAKFARITARVVFSRHAVITAMEGRPTLMLRVGNERANHILEAQLRVTLVRREVTREGQLFYRMYELPLVRDRSSALSRSWSVMHVIEEESPLFGMDAASMAATESELLVTLVGMDDTSLQPVHARKTYADADVVWNARHVDILHEEAGTLVVDLRRFHDLEPAEPVRFGEAGDAADRAKDEAGAA